VADSAQNAKLRAKVAAMNDDEKEAFVEGLYATCSPTPEILGEFSRDVAYRFCLTQRGTPESWQGVLPARTTP